MATKSTAKVYKCRTCGLVTTEKGHLCRPKEVKKAYSCEYCGITVSDPIGRRSAAALFLSELDW